MSLRGESWGKNFATGPIPYDFGVVSFFSHPGLILSSIYDI